MSNPEVNMIAEMFKQGLANATQPLHPKPKKEDYQDSKLYKEALSKVHRTNKSILEDREFFEKDYFHNYAISIGVEPSVIKNRYYDLMKKN